MTHQPAQAATAEVVAGRELAQGNSGQHTRVRTQGRAARSRARDRVRQAAKERAMRVTAVWHHSHSSDRLREAYYRLNHDAAPGMDGQTWATYGEQRDTNLRERSDRRKRGAYQASPVERVSIPKAEGRQRPIGQPTREDNIVQRAPVEGRNAISEEECVGCSYGARPGRHPHHALDAVTVGRAKRRSNGGLEAAMRGFYEAIDPAWLVQCVEHRSGDQRVVRHLRKWLTAGVREDGQWRQQEAGTPQGGRASPWRAHLSLHYVCDLWAAQGRRRPARGAVILVRSCDECIGGFQNRDEAEQVLSALRERFHRVPRARHPEKTRLRACGRSARERRQRRGQGTPETVDFLGVPHMCGTTKRGKCTVRRCPIRQTATQETPGGQADPARAYALAHREARGMA
jgi:RNA-directed DNA polymerase